MVPSPPPPSVPAGLQVEPPQAPRTPEPALLSLREMFLEVMNTPHLIRPRPAPRSHP